MSCEGQSTQDETIKPNVWQELLDRQDIHGNVSLEEYAVSDSQVETCAAFSNEELIIGTPPLEEEEEEELLEVANQEDSKKCLRMKL